MTATELAASRFAAGHNCAQAVLAAFAGRFGLDAELALRLPAAFGAGIGRTGDTCGAVAGALMVLGLRYGSAAPDAEAKEKTYAAAREFMDRFRLRHDTVICRELLGCDISSPEGLALVRERNYHEVRCARFVCDAVEILDGMV